MHKLGIGPGYLAQKRGNLLDHTILQFGYFFFKLSGSHVSRTKFKLNTVAVLLGCSGEQSDALSAYTQSDLCERMPGGSVIDTWI